MFFKLSSPPTNKEITLIFRAIAAAYTNSNVNIFRIQAYEKAADSIEHASREVYDMWQDGTLGKLPGIGGSMIQHLDELFRSGKSSHFDEIIDGFPPGMFALLNVPGIGPKNAYKFALKLGLTRYHSAITKLEKAARQGEIAQIDGFGEDSQARILAGIEEYYSQGERLLIHIADKVASEMIEYLKASPDVKQADPLGSLRRRVATVGDIDLAAATDNSAAVIEYFTKYPQTKRVIEAGTVSATILLNNDLHVDLIVQDIDSYGALLQHFTGSKRHNITLRELALEKGFSLSEKGIQIVKTKKQLKFTDEQAFYQYLGLDWIPPELREGNGEIPAAQKNKLPNLIELSDLKGDFHMHSSFDINCSHDRGLSDMESMVQQALQLGYEYIGFSEHNPVFSQSVSQIVELMKTKDYYVKKLNQLLQDKKETAHFHIFNGLEIDIRPDGELALPEEAFQYIDYAIASVHSSFRMDKQQMTDRILKALEHPKVKILGHPTGRVINVRQGYEIDWDRLFSFCAANNKWIEIDGWPDRLDLPDTQVRQAIASGVKLTIDSDAHQVDHMEMIKYGVSVARRGWTEKSSIINTLSLSDLKQLFK